MFSAADSDALHARVRALIRGGPEPFDALALDLARFQAAHVPAFARLLRARGVDLAAARSASAIPAVPTDVFRLARIAVHPPDCDVALFRTSGTTHGARGEHPLRTTETYELAALSWGARFLWPDGPGLGVMVLAPPLSEQPDSSLGFMLDRFAHELDGPAGFHVHLSAAGEAHLDLDGIARAAAGARAAARPTLVLATSFALVHLLDQAAGLDLRLPAGSRVMQTGGFKGRSREVAPEALRALVATAFGVPPDHVVGEYGMTELSSQLYEGTLAAALKERSGSSIAQTSPPIPLSLPRPVNARSELPRVPGQREGEENEKRDATGSPLSLVRHPHHNARKSHGPGQGEGGRGGEVCGKQHGVYQAPPWVRVSAVDPVTLEPVAPGEVGVARIVDLANVDSVVAVQTADRVRVGDGGVELLGRLPGATPRGCSIAVDEMLGRA